MYYIIIHYIILFFISTANNLKLIFGMHIAFWDNQLCERGTTVSLYDYAFYNQTLLGNKSYIFYDKNNRENKEKIIQKFKKYFTVHKTDDFKKWINNIF